MTYFSKSTGPLVRAVVAAATMAPLLASCSNDEGNEPATDYTTYRVAFTLNLTDANSRAAGDNNWSDPTDRVDGTDIENVINWSDFHVALYDNSNNYLGYVLNPTLINTEQTGSGIYEKPQHTVEGVLMFKDAQSMTPTQLKDYNPKVMIVTNATPSGSSASELQANMTAPNFLNKYTFNWATIEGYEADKRFLPMWGVATPASTAFDIGEDKKIDLGEISLLRAVAKIEVELSNELIGQGVTLTDAVLSKRNSLGYLLPNKAFGVEKTEILGFNETLHVPTTDQTLTTNFKVDAVSASPDTPKTISFYLPEYDNTPEGAASQDELTLTVSFKKEDESGSGIIKFRKNPDGTYNPTGTAYDIVRNHIYRYTITGVNPNYEFTINWTVCPMDEATINVPPFE